MSTENDGSQECYECPVDGCMEVYPTQDGLNGHQQSHAGEKPYHDHEELRRLYEDELYTLYELADLWNCSITPIKHNLREASASVRNAHETRRLRHMRRPVNFYTDDNGYEIWEDSYEGERTKVRVHQLLAIADGADPYEVFAEENGVHHGPEAEIPWANWHANVQVMSNSIHAHHHNPREVSNGDLLAELQRLADEHGGTVVQRTIVEHSRHGANTYYRRFGSLKAAQRKAGLSVHTANDPVSKDDIAASIQRLKTKLGREPTVTDMREHGEHGVTSVYRKFKSWTAAKEAAFDTGGEQRTLDDV